MKTSTIATLGFALSTLAAAQAMASNIPQQQISRDQVRAELAQAQQSGDISAGKNVGMLWTTGSNLNDLYPSRFPAKSVEQAKSSAQVQSELAQAQRSGDISAGKDAGMLWTTGSNLNDLYPARYPSKAVTAAKTRDDVRTELALAQQERSQAGFSVIGTLF